MDATEVAEMIMKGMTDRDISHVYESRFPTRSGFSERSVRRFCKVHGLHKPSGAFLDTIVEESVREVYTHSFYLYVWWRYWLDVHIWCRLDMCMAEGC